MLLWIFTKSSILTGLLFDSLAFSLSWNKQASANPSWPSSNFWICNLIRYCSNSWLSRSIAPRCKAAMKLLKASRQAAAVDITVTRFHTIVSSTRKKLLLQLDVSYCMTIALLLEGNACSHFIISKIHMLLGHVSISMY